MSEAFRDYIGDIYVQDSSESGTTGSICWAPVYYTTSTVNVVRPVVNDPAASGFGQYTVKCIQLAAIADSRKVPFEHRFPDKNLKLSLGEDLFVVRGKVRPVVILFNPRQQHDRVVKDGAKSESEVGMCFGCAPLYSLTNPAGNFTHKPEFVENVRAMKYAQFCYMPPHPLLEDDREAFVRLDRIAWYPPAVLQPIKVKLNSVGLDYLLAFNDWLTRGTSLPKEIADTRDFFMELTEDARRQLIEKQKK